MLQSKSTSQIFTILEEEFEENKLSENDSEIETEL